MIEAGKKLPLGIVYYFSFISLIYVTVNPAQSDGACISRVTPLHFLLKGHSSCQGPRLLQGAEMQTSLIAFAAILCLSSCFTCTNRPRRESLLLATNVAAQQLYFDIAIERPSEELELGRLTFNLTTPDNPHYLPLHSANLVNLAMGTRKAVDAKATYEGCMFQFSPATIDDGSFRYKWGHSVDGNGRNAIQTDQADGSRTSFDEPFRDPERLLECSHECFGGVYYGQQYEEIVEALQIRGEDVAVFLTVPIRGPGAGTSKFSVVRVSESPQEW